MNPSYELDLNIPKIDYLEIPYLISIIGDSKFKIILKDFKKHIINYLFKKL